MFLYVEESNTKLQTQNNVSHIFLIPNYIADELFENV